jgi:hypothetical protein
MQSKIHDPAMNLLLKPPIPTCTRARYASLLSTVRRRTLLLLPRRLLLLLT